MNYYAGIVRNLKAGYGGGSISAYAAAATSTYAAALTHKNTTNITAEITAKETANLATRKETDEKTAKDYKNAENKAWLSYTASTMIADVKYWVSYKVRPGRARSGKEPSQTKKRPHKPKRGGGKGKTFFREKP